MNNNDDRTSVGGDEFWADLVRVLGGLRLAMEADRTLLDAGEGSLTVSGQGVSQTYLARRLPRPRLDQVLRWTSSLSTTDRDRTKIVLAHRVSWRTAAALRQNDIDYVDLEGRASLAFPGVLVRVDGGGPSTGAAASPLPSSVDDPPANLLSPTRAQVIFALLQWPEVQQAPVRTIATCAGVSPSLVHDTLALLVKQQLLVVGDDPRRRLRAPDLLVDSWVGAYRLGLRQKLLLGRFHTDLDVWTGQDHEDDLHLSGGLAVANDVRAASVSVFVDALTPAVRRRYRLAVDGRRPNTEVLRRFWTAPPLARSPAPWLMDYAELATSDDARLRDAAALIRSRARA